MIQYSLKCDAGHSFDSWFQSAEAFDALKRSGLLECAHCGSASVEKAIMAPRVTSARKKAAAPEQVPAAPEQAQTQTMAATSDTAMQDAIKEMRAQVEANSDYVGDNFATEARSMHLGDTPERAIYGQANAEEAKSLIEDGVPVLPLPFTPTRKTN